jgi:hypothetical protein
MNIFKNYINQYCVPLFIIIFNLIINLSVISQENENIYREQVYLNPARDTYITSENIWFEAHCLNLKSPSSSVLSKVMYVELINDKNEHILGQILNIIENKAESNISLPDTLQTGIYYLKAYTQWMINFGPESFFSTPVFIYNQFDERSSDQLSLINLSSGPKLFIEGENLIAGIKAKVVTSFPNFKGKEELLGIVDSDSNKIITSFRLNADGEGRFEFVPEKGHKYVCSNSDSASGIFSYILPEVLSSGYKIDIISVSENSVTVKIENQNAGNQKLELVLKSGNLLIEQKNFKQEDLGKELIKPFVSKRYVINEVILKDSFGKTLAKNEFAYLPKNPINISIIQDVFHSREQVDMKVLLDNNSGIDSIDAAISIHKTHPSFQIQNEINPLYTNNSSKVRFTKIQDNFYTILHEFNSEINQINTPNYSSDLDSFLPVEDMGILINGTAMDANHNPLADLEILFSMKDSVPDLQSETTNKDGKFTFLLNENGNRLYYLFVNKENHPFNDRIEITIDNKFYYKKNTIKPVILNPLPDSGFVSELIDEAKRVLIQRVFEKKENKEKTTFTIIPQKTSYFDNSKITVYPDDFFDMPNFEEIAREILPLVRYRKTDDGCSISIYNPEPGTRSLVPLVLVDGVPVVNKCDLYSLSSEKIRKINIQFQPRIVGNLYYDGLIGIYSNPDKEFKYSDSPNSYSFFLTGYNPVKNFSKIEITENLKDKNPKFKNQLYWDTFFISSKKENEIKFNTSDEEGEYIVEINGFSKNGIPVKFQQKFTVSAK